MREFRFLLTASDYQRTVDFYTRVLGLPVVTSWEGDDPGTIVRATNEGEIEIFSGDGNPISGAALAWQVDDVDAEIEAVRARGATVVTEPSDQLWGHRNATIVDPDGLNITLFQVLRPE